MSDATVDEQLPGRGRLANVSALVDELNAELERGEARELVPVATGFTPLDRVLGGGVHPGALTIVGGAPGVGKTVMALQWARQMALDGQDVIYVCYEHEEVELLVRLLTMELQGLPSEVAEAVRDAVVTSAASAGAGLQEILSSAKAGDEVLERLGAYGSRLHLVRASGAHTGVPEIEAFIDQLSVTHPVVFVDYLQKVRLEAATVNEAEKVTLVTEALKDLALNRQIPVITLAAVEMEGLRTRRVRMHHFRGSSALVFESDVALVMNDKVNAVSKAHLAYDPLGARGFRDWVVLSVEKNRGGPNHVDVEYRKDFERFRFDPTGRLVSERLTDDVMDEL